MRSIQRRRLGWPAFAIVLTCFTLITIQNTVDIEIRLLYFSDRFDAVETNLSTALIAACLVGFLLGLFVGRLRG